MAIGEESMDCKGAPLQSNCHLALIHIKKKLFIRVLDFIDFCGSLLEIEWYLDCNKKNPTRLEIKVYFDLNIANL